jgi:hypothetical protein
VTRLALEGKRGAYGQVAQGKVAFVAQGRRAPNLLVGRKLHQWGVGGGDVALATSRSPPRIGADLLATLGLRSVLPHYAAFASPVQRSLGGSSIFAIRLQYTR